MHNLSHYQHPSTKVTPLLQLNLHSIIVKVHSLHWGLFLVLSSLWVWKIDNNRHICHCITVSHVIISLL